VSAGLAALVAGWLPAACALATWLLLVVLLRSGLAARWAIDVPNERSMHHVPTPRIGGIGLLAVALPVAAALAPATRTLAALAAALAVVSAIDDQRGLSVRVRLAVHTLVAAVGAFVLLPAQPAWWLLAVVPAIVWSINLYNFMDGADGLAGGMAVAGFGAFGIAAWPLDAGFALACLAIAGAAAGFLLLNFHPARLFMGDAGSAPLGFLAAAFGVYGAVRGFWPPWYPALAFLPFVIDATLTLLARLLRGERVWLAHKDHCYQRMIGAGLGHARTAAIWYAAMAVAAALATVSLQWPGGLQRTVAAACAAAGVLLWFLARRAFDHRP
jgi:UDP-N-acetylmuramyl pentapeptide phosphotransferase/UDP-N-acetylglucosamine-1-phosphate transferase